MFTQLPELFGRDFAVGFFLPALFLVTGTLLLVGLVLGLALPGFQVVPVGSAHPGAFQLADVPSATFVIGLLVLAALAAAVLLLGINRFLVRLLEGYLPPVRWLGGWGRWRYRRLMAAYAEAVNQYRAEQAQGNVSEATRKKYRELSDWKTKYFPDQEQYVLPTAFGNIIRAAEVYPRVLYGADLIPLWPRLLGVIPADYRGFIDSSRASMDFAVNSFYVALLLAVESAVLFSLNAAAARLWTAYGWLVLALLVAAFVAYQLALSTALEWGQFLRSAADLYLDDLLKQLSYPTVLESAEQRKRWQALSRSFLYLEPLPERTPKQDPESALGRAAAALRELLKT